MPLLPKPYPDELVGSILCRSVRHNSLPLSAQMKCLYGQVSSRYSFLMCRQPDTIARLCGIGARELLIRHTILPYSVAFLPQVAKERYLKEILQENRVLIASAVRAVTKAVPYRRVCLPCIEHELKKFGESYWHRRHQLPGVFYCIEHGVKLYNTDVALRREGWSNSLRLPHEVALVPMELVADSKLLREVTRLSNEAMEWAFSVHEDSTRYLRELALEAGYQSYGRRLASYKLDSDLLRDIGSEYLASMGCAAPGNSSLTGVVLRPRRPDTRVASRYIVIVSYLADRKPVLEEEIAAVYRAIPRRVSDFATSDSELSAFLKNRIERSRAARCRTSVKELMENAPHRELYRHNRGKFPKSRALIEQFRNSDSSIRQEGWRPEWRERFPARFAASKA